MAKNVSLEEFRKRYSTERKCRRFLESVLWKNGRFCPHCGSLKSWPIKGPSTQKRPGLYECKACHKQFTVTVKTPFHSTKLPLPTWFQIIYLMLSSSKSISSRKMATVTGISQKSAWKVKHAVREMMDMRDEIGPVLRGIVEVDEKYVGGVPRKQRGVVNKRGKGTKKQPVLVLVERRGQVRIEVIRNDSYDEIAPLVKKHISPAAQLMTDQHAVYKKLGPEFSGHEFVNHGENEFAKGPVHKNTAESVNAIIEMVNKGVFHQWSRKHLHRYLNEIAFRWNQRKETEKKKYFKGRAVVGGKKVM